MKALQRYIDDHNSWGKLFKNHTPWAIPTTRAEAEPIFESLEGDLSPENLCCDGEISQAAVRKKLRHFTAVHKQLESIVGTRELMC